MSTDHDLLHAAQPEAAAALDQMLDTARRSTDADLLELCRRRVVARLGDAAQQDLVSPRTDREQAYLAFTDQFVFSVAGMSDADVQALLDYDEPVEVYRFVAALYTLEMSLRIELASRIVLAPEEVNT